MIIMDEQKNNENRSPKDKSSHSGRRGDPVSLSPLTPDEALAAALRVNPEDMKKLEQKEKAKKKREKKGRKKA